PQPTGDYARADGVRPFEFPKDMGPHPDFQTEWWYYTGNLKAENGQEYGFQLTFFRRALLGSEGQSILAQRSSAWATDQVYLAHFALTDVAGGQFHAFERFERGAEGLPMYRVWLHDWSVEQTGPETYQLKAEQDGVALRLDLQDVKGLILQGDRGYSQKGPQPGNASYYVSQTRLRAGGEITVAGKTLAVSGTSWMDHEYSTSALSEGQVGWDWFSIQLDDGSEWMLYTIRRADGSIDPFSKGTLIAPDGTTRSLAAGDFTIEALDTWKSPHSGGVYPSRWRIQVPSEGLTLQIEPLIADQELNLSFVYWEGAVRISGECNGAAVSGKGYVELTGYAGSMAGEF
ncbi:MAG TPA: lipocalin-like domain-containing protein, partial [Anaerolinea sp.]|nr:lipocalin-like domain-containing protein [Anaerolinea sp.]